MNAPCDRCAKLEAALREARQAFKWIASKRRDVGDLLYEAQDKARDAMRAIDKALEGKP